MGQRRMFSNRIVQSARFLKMPISSQALYFHLGMRADDDGVVEAYNVLKACGCTEDDLRVLVAKGLVQVLNEDLVAYIIDWTENNTIRPDRKIDSIYKDLLISMKPDVKLIEKRPRADAKRPTNKQGDDQVTTDGQPMDVQWTTNGRHKLSKDKLSKDKLIKKERGNFVPPTLQEVQTYITEQGYHVNAQSFVDFYASKGWMVGKNKMKDWKAAVRTWEQRDRKDKRSKVPVTQFDFDGQRSAEYYEKFIKRIEGGN